MNYLTVVPAYGRDYKTARDARADWDAGKDFKDPRTDQYLSKRDIDSSTTRVTIRFSSLRKLVNV